MVLRKAKTMSIIIFDEYKNHEMFLLYSFVAIAISMEIAVMLYKLIINMRLLICYSKTRGMIVCDVNRYKISICEWWRNYKRSLRKRHWIYIFDKVYYVIIFSLIMVYICEKGLFKMYIYDLYEWLLQFPPFESIIHMLRDHEVPIWVPKETSKNVFIGYSLICILSLVYAFRYWFYSVDDNRRDAKVRLLADITHENIFIRILECICGKLYSLFYVFVFCVSLATIIEMAKYIYPRRWHHMSIGLLLTFTGLRTPMIFGTYLIFDSMGYWVNYYYNYGFDNVIMDNYKIFGITIIIGITLEYISTYIKNKIYSRILEHNENNIVEPISLGSFDNMELHDSSENNYSDYRYQII